MIEFVLKNRKFRLHPDGIMYYRKQVMGVDTIRGTLWEELKPSLGKNGYYTFGIKIDGKHKHITVHRVVYYAHNQDWDIFNGSQNNCIDHINGDKLDNRIENLRNVTNQQNLFNSKAKGCSWNKNRGKWASYIMINRKKKHLGYFDNEEEAHNAYLEEKRTLHAIE